MVILLYLYVGFLVMPRIYFLASPPDLLGSRGGVISCQEVLNRFSVTWSNESYLMLDVSIMLQILYLYEVFEVALTIRKFTAERTVVPRIAFMSVPGSRKQYDMSRKCQLGIVPLTCSNDVLKCIKSMVIQLESSQPVSQFSHQLVRLNNMPVMGSSPKWTVPPYVGLTILLWGVNL